MALGRAYTITSGLVTFTGTSATPIFYGAATATATADISAIRIGMYSGSSASYPTNGTIEAQLSRVTGTVGGGGTITAVPANSADIAANTTFKDGTTAITGLTQGVTLWAQSLPFTAGANWAEWFSQGYEKRVPASGLFAVYLTASSAGTATQFVVELEFTE